MPPDPLRVAAVQFKGRRPDVGASREALAALARRAARGTHLVVLPEMAATGYTFPDAAAVRAVAESPRGPTFQALSQVSAEAGCWLVCGYPERARDRLFNSAMVIDPAGQLAFTYRKTLLFDADLHWASPGDSGYRRFDTDAGSMGVGICMDLNDDRFVRWCARADLDAIAFPTNWVDEGIDVWSYWRFRLLGVRGALVAANTWGREGELGFSGRSAVMQRGSVLVGAPPTGDLVLTAAVAQSS